MFKGLGGLGDMAGMMKKAQEMQGKMAELQEEMHSIMVTGASALPSPISALASSSLTMAARAGAKYT